MRTPLDPETCDCEHGAPSLHLTAFASHAICSACACVHVAAGRAWDVWAIDSYLPVCSGGAAPVFGGEA